MLSELIELRQRATILFAQTTYLHLSVGTDTFRVDFERRVEARLKPGKHGSLVLHAQHPLLLRYNEASATLYISSKPTNPQALQDDVHQAIVAILQGWRDWCSSLFGFGGNKDARVALLAQNLAQGSGILLDQAPASIVRAVVAVCVQHGVMTNVFGSIESDSTASPLFQVLLVGSCYVIAKDFRLTAL